MSIEWNRNLYERIRAAADRGAVHHALLLTGPKGSGKGELARFIAAAMECQAPQGRAPDSPFLPSLHPKNVSNVPKSASRMGILIPRMDSFPNISIWFPREPYPASLQIPDANSAT